MAILHVRLLGDFQLLYDGQAVAGLNQTRHQSLLAYLLLHRAIPQSRQQLAFLFWPDSSEAQARANLRQMLHHLRHTLPDADRYLQLAAKTVQWLADAASFSLDIAAFEQQLAQAARAAERGQHELRHAALMTAVEQYHGDLLPTCYDDWILRERERWRAKFIQALEQLVLLLEEQRDYAAAITYAQRLLRHDPLHETTYRQLMRLYALNGDRASALRTYHTCVTLLQRELDVEPHPTTQEVYAHLFNLEPPPVQQSAITPRSVGAERLVGRQAEWKKLQTAWRQTTHGGAHFVLVAGEAGIGKTRLAEELLHWVSQQGMMTARTRSYAAEGDLAYAPVIDWLRSETLQAALARLDIVWRTEVARLLPELLAQQPALPRPTPLAERWQRQRLFEALARAFLLAQQPLLLVIDDLQWCDQETLEWLHYLLRYATRAQLLVVGTCRSEEVGEEHPLTTLLSALQREAQITELALEPLNPTETRALARQTAGQELDSTTLEKLVQFTEGNPLFVIETAGVQSGGWAGALNLEHQSLPPKVQAVIQHRLRQLSSAAREVASLAAVSGRSFTFATLAQAGDLGEEALVRALDELWQKRIIRQQGLNAYDFSHDRIREAAYRVISPMRRRLLHSRLAKALTYLHQDDLDDISATLASHYEQGGLVQQAIDWYQRAATVAERRYVYISAINYVDAALRLLLLLPQTPESIKQQLSLLLAKGSYLMPVYGLVSQERAKVYQQVEAIVNRVSDDRLRFIARSRLRGIYGVSGRMLEAYEQAEQLLILARQLAEPLLSLEACQGYGMVNLQLGRLPVARQYWTEAEELFALKLSEMERAEYGPIAGTMGNLALALWLLGYPEQARRKIVAALAQTETIVNPPDSSIVLFFADLLYRHMGEAKLLIGVLEKLSTLYAQYAIWLSRLGSLSLQGWLAVQQGDFAQSLEPMRMEIDELKKIGHTMFQTHRMGLLIEAQLKAGQLAAASATLDEAFAMSEQSGQRSWDADLYRLKGELLYAMGAAGAEAVFAYGHALQLARQQNAKILELRATVSLCRLLKQQGKRTEAHQRLTEIYAWFTEGFDTADLQAAKALLDELAF